MEEPITPSHLIVGRRILNLPDNLDGVRDFNDDDFTLDANQINNRVIPNDDSSQISVGEMVIVKDDRLPRGLWKLGLVQEIMKGREGRTRAAVVNVASRDRQHSILKRPIQLLYPLEIQCELIEASRCEPPLDPESSDQESSPEDDSTTSGSVRKEQPPRRLMR
jgi:hypothetical protein